MNPLPPEVATRDRPAPSPSGSYLLVVKEETREGSPPDLYFQILDQQGTLLFESDERYSDRHMTYFLWDQADRVWVYSGDVGTSIWEQSGDPGTWLKSSYAESDLPGPRPPEAGAADDLRSVGRPFKRRHAWFSASHASLRCLMKIGG